MVGLIENIKNKMTLNFKEEGDIIYLLGNMTNDINCSEYLHKVCKVSIPPLLILILRKSMSFRKNYWN
jgi:phosphoribosylformylglycinamidine synthase